MNFWELLGVDEMARCVQLSKKWKQCRPMPDGNRYNIFPISLVHNPCQMAVYQDLERCWNSHEENKGETWHSLEQSFFSLFLWGASGTSFHHTLPPKKALDFTLQIIQLLFRATLLNILCLNFNAIRKQVVSLPLCNIFVHLCTSWVFPGFSLVFPQHSFLQNVGKDSIKDWKVVVWTS